MTHYGPVAVLWWDTPTGSMTPERTDGMKAMLKLQPGIITNNRLGDRNGGDTQTPEQEIPANGIPGKDWETCMNMGTHWGYIRNVWMLASSDGKLTSARGRRCAKTGNSTIPGHDPHESRVQGFVTMIRIMCHP